MPKVTFSPMTIKNLKPEDKSIEYFDNSREHGEGAFGLRISPKNKRTWFVMYKGHNSKIMRYTLGVYPALSLKDARKKAGDVMAEVNKGNDPMSLKQTKKTAPTMIDLWAEYKNERARMKQPKAASTIIEEDRRWKNNICPAIGQLKVQDIEPRNITDLLNIVATKTPVSANRLYALLRVVFKVAIQQGWIQIHPMQWLSKPGGSEPPRKRYLSDEEIKTLWPYFDKLRSNPRDILKLGLLTAQRPGEIMSMRWEDIEFENEIWRQNDTKNGSTNLVPLSPQVKSILLARKPEDIGNVEWVFPSNYNCCKGAVEGRAKSTKDARKDLQELSGITGWTAHDLRRTARTIMSRLQIKQHIRERVLNHAQGGVVGVYDQYDYLQEKADALNKLADEIDRILNTP